MGGWMDQGSEVTGLGLSSIDGRLLRTSDIYPRPQQVTAFRFYPYLSGKAELRITKTSIPKLHSAPANVKY